MQFPTLSVILPNYNHGHCLPTAVEAILKQSVQPDEILIIDDGSTDQSVEVIEQLAARHTCIKFHRNDRNRGVCFTANRALDLASGTFVFATAADDVILPGFFEKSMRLLAQHPQAGLCCTIGDWREEHTGLNWHMGVGMATTPSYLPPERIVELERQGRFFIPTNSVIARRSSLIEAGKYIPELKDTIDWFSSSVIAFRHGICVVPEPLCVLQINPNSYYHRSRRDKEGHRKVLELILSLLHQPAYRDVAEYFRRAGSLYLFATPMLRLLFSRREYRRFLTPTLLRRSLWHTTKVKLKRFVPAAIGNLYFRLSGYRASRASQDRPSA